MNYCIDLNHFFPKHFQVLVQLFYLYEILPPVSLFPDNNNNNHSSDENETDTGITEM